MQILKKTKKRNLLILLLALFIFFRAVVFIDESLLGLDIYEASLVFSLQNLVLLLLMILFAVLSAIIIFKTHSSCEEAAFICILIVADPVFFVMQNNSIKLFVCILGMLFILNILRDKPFIKNEIMLCIFLIVSTFLMPYTIFCFTPFVLIIYFVTEIDSFTKNKSKILSLILSLLCSFVGILLNKLFCHKFIWFENFLTSLSFSENYKEDKIITILLLAIPSAVFGRYFFNKYLKISGKKSKKNAVINIKHPQLLVGILVGAYVLLIVGFVINGIKSISTINLLIPTTILILSTKKDELTYKIVNSINVFIQKYIFLVLLFFILYCYISTLILKNSIYISNIVSYILKE